MGCKSFSFVLEHPQAGLSTLERLILFVLSLNRDDSNGTCHPSQKRMAKNLGKEDRSGVSKAISGLVKKGALSVVRPDAHHGVNHYRLLHDGKDMPTWKRGKDQNNDSDDTHTSTTTVPV